MSVPEVWNRANPLILSAGEGWTTRPGTDLPGDRFIISGADTDGRFAMVTHPIEPGWFAPPHTHTREDEYSYVLEGTFGFEVGDRELEAGPGSLVFKPRNLRHAFWNTGTERGLILELISPAGLERFFAEALDLFRGGRLPPPDATRELGRKYGAEVDEAATPAFLARHGLHAPDAPPWGPPRRNESDSPGRAG